MSLRRICHNQTVFVTSVTLPVFYSQFTLASVCHCLQVPANGAMAEIITGSTAATTAQFLLLELCLILEPALWLQLKFTTSYPS